MESHRRQYLKSFCALSRHTVLLCNCNFRRHCHRAKNEKMSGDVVKGDGWVRLLPRRQQEFLSCETVRKRGPVLTCVTYITKIILTPTMIFFSKNPTKQLCLHLTKVRLGHMTSSFAAHLKLSCRQHKWHAKSLKYVKWHVKCPEKVAYAIPR